MKWIFCIWFLIIFNLYLNEIYAEQVCGDIVILNGVEDFKKLVNCNVIEGSLKMYHLDNLQPSDLENLTFPYLVEVTDFILFYKLRPITTFKKLFPNLAVIRGRQLYKGFALIIYDNRKLSEIGLIGLTSITRGRIRIQKNPNLCFVETINWDIIAPEGRHIIDRNNEHCPLCKSSCPTLGSSIHHCWNLQHCQRICSNKCRDKNATCMINNLNECCEKGCLGGCWETSPSHCLACAEIKEDDECHSKCSEHKYLFRDRRCVSKAICNVDHLTFEDRKVPKCLEQCPTDYYAKDGSCVYCGTNCSKTCNGTKLVDSESIRKLKGCTKINGSLILSLKDGPTIIKDLEESLASISNITGFLRITRSDPLTSLHFFKNLKFISGVDKDRGSYTLSIHNNPNLKTLFPLHNVTYNIEVNGKLFFHLNPYLCMSEIKLLFKNDVIPPENEVSSYSNGDKAVCNVKNFNVTTKNVTHNLVQLSWPTYPPGLLDRRSVLAHVIHYRKTSNSNISIYDGQNACNNDEWQMDIIEGPFDGKKETLTHSVTGLDAFSKYAFYISLDQSYERKTVATVVRSYLIYVKTDSTTPKSPENLRIISTGPNDIEISWNPPEKPNGIIAFYLISVYLHDTILTENGDSEHCTPELVYKPLKKIKEVEEVKPFAVNEKNSTCSCKTDLQKKMAEKEEEIIFEDSLINSLFSKSKTKSTNNDRTKRAINEENGIKFKVPSNILKYRITNLTHFGSYSIEVQACQNKTKNRRPCSTSAMVATRTESLEGKDDIDGSTITFLSENSTDSSTNLILRWNAPSKPNGKILSYKIEYKLANADSKTGATRKCISHKEYMTYNGTYIPNLSPGSYLFRIQAVSHARFGAWTEYIEYSVISRNSNLEWIIILSLVFIALIILTGVWLVLKYKYCNQLKMEYVSVNPQYISAVLGYSPDKWEVSRENVKLIKTLGQGAFGTVYEGQVKNPYNIEGTVKCAVKTSKESADIYAKKKFLMEASVMKQFDCYHVVKLLAIVSISSPPLVCMELMSNGDLKAYLISQRPGDGDEPKTSLSPSRIHLMALEIADGMAYLTSQKFVHRDLAARNCMVSSDLTVKIGDFGMTRDIYENDYYKKDGNEILPVRWMSPESIKMGVFTTHSDVWSYGVVLYEIVSFGALPYQGLSNSEVYKYVSKGNKLNIPENCPSLLSDLMDSCWHQNPIGRPTFMEIATTLLPQIEPLEFPKESFYFQNKQSIPQKKEQEDETTPLRAEDEENDYNINSGEASGYKFFSPSFSEAQENGKSFHNDAKSNGNVPNGHVYNTTPC